jgi:hypothetical protein
MPLSVGVVRSCLYLAAEASCKCTFEARQNACRHAMESLSLQTDLNDRKRSTAGKPSFRLRRGQDHWQWRGNHEMIRTQSLGSGIAFCITVHYAHADQRQHSHSSFPVLHPPKCGHGFQYNTALPLPGRPSRAVRADSDGCAWASTVRFVLKHVSGAPAPHRTSRSHATRHCIVC